MDSLFINSNCVFKKLGESRSLIDLEKIMIGESSSFLLFSYLAIGEVVMLNNGCFYLLYLNFDWLVVFKVS
jgi:hypothetical protein